MCPPSPLPIARTRLRRARGWRAAGRVIIAVAAFWPLGAAAIVQPGSLDAPESDADLFRVTCTDDGSGAPASLRLELLATTAASSRLVSAQIQKGVRATNTTDPTSSDASPAPTVAVDGGPGIYDVFVDKSDAGAETYELDLACMTGAGGTGVPTGIQVEGDESVPATPLVGWLALLVGIAAGAARMRR